MAGTLTIGTLSDGTNSTSSTNAIMGSAKAWVNFGVSGGVATINASYNVSSVTYVVAGGFRINFTNALTDANYTVVGQGSSNTAGAQSGTWTLQPPTPGYANYVKSTTQVYVTNGTQTGIYDPNGPVSVAVFR